MSEDWTEAHRPEDLNGIKGNPKAVKELRDWAESWNRGAPTKKAVILIGPPGVGKTSAALALANEMGWGLVEMNASDQRTGDAIRQVALRAAYSNTFNDEGDYLSINEGGRKLILLDEADNLFGREDRGAIPAIIELIKETMQPVILIVNDFYGLSRKSSSLKTNTLQITFYRPRSTEIAKVLSGIAVKRGIGHTPSAINAIAENSRGDLRAAVRDLESLSLGRDSISQEDTEGLSGRVVRKDIYQLMDSIFRSKDPAKAHRMMMDIDEGPDHILLWLDENMPYESRDAGDLVRGYEKLSRADVFMGRVRRRQYYRFWSYASDMMSMGVAQSRQATAHQSQRFHFPSYLMKMSRSKAVRDMKGGLVAKLAEHCHTSSSRARQDILPYVQMIFRNDVSFRRPLIMALGLDVEEAAFLLDEKVDSKTVKELFKAPQTQDGQGKTDGKDNQIRNGPSNNPKAQSNLFDF